MRLSDYLIRPVSTSTEPSGQYNLQLEAYNLAVKLMNKVATDKKEKQGIKLIDADNLDDITVILDNNGKLVRIDSSEVYYLEPMRKERYNQGFYDGYRKATEQTNERIETIKAEIEKTAWSVEVSHVERAYGMWDAYRIIDKHMKGERE